MTTTNILGFLKNRGFKITRGRKLIIEIIATQDAPISPLVLLERLHGKNLLLNKTTVYRELEFLVKQNIVKEIQFGERNKRYEIKSKLHHHHIVCNKCKKVEEIASDTLEKKLDLLEKEIFQIKNFQGINHSLEFFGTCNRCS